MAHCNYRGKGCSKEDICNISEKRCGLVKYFDFIVGNSPECQNSPKQKDIFVLDWKLRQKIDPRCEGCKNVQSDGYCRIFVIPSKRWPDGEVSYDNKCIQASHIKYEKKKPTFKRNPLKASRKAARRVLR